MYSRGTSKSIFTNTPRCITQKNIFNPAYNTDLSFPTEILANLNTAYASYTNNLATRNYSKIPTDIETYLKLLISLTDFAKAASSVEMNLVLKMVTDALKGAMNIQVIFNDNLSLNLKVLLLNKKIEEILSNKNNKEVFESAGNFSVTKKFVLSPIYSAYIYLYGMPAYSVGFDELKLNSLFDLFNTLDISPY